MQEAPRVALVLKTLDSPFFSSLRQGAEEAAAEAGLDLTVQAAERQVDVQQQMQVIESLIEAKVDVLLIDPVGSFQKREGNNHLGFLAKISLKIPAYQEIKNLVSPANLNIAFNNY